LNYSLYGTRDAASNWEEHYTQVLIDIGFTRGLSSPCVFHHDKRDITTVINGYYFTTLANYKELRWSAAELKYKFEIKDRGIMGPDDNDIKEIRLLNRILAWEDDGIRYEADQRHAEILINTLKLEDANGVNTPGTKNSNDENDEEDDYLKADEATVFRACVARCNFLGLDRPDVQYAAKEISRHMAKPRQRDVAALKRLGRYLKQYPRAIFKYRFQKMPNKVRVVCDSNYAGCTETRKSTQGGVAMLGQHCVKSWSSTQATVALSSAEAEFYGIVKACSVSLGMRSLLADMKTLVSLDVLTDASAAKGMASQKGLPNKARHINVHVLWIQEKVITKDIHLQKIWGHDNPADLLIKFLDTGTIARHARAFGLECREGRSADASPKRSP